VTEAVDACRRPWWPAVLAYLVVALAWPCAARAGSVVLLRSKALTPYEAAAAGFHDAYRGEVVDILLDGRDPDSLATALLGRHPDVVVAVGLRAALFVRDRLPYTPMVHCVVQDAGTHDLVGERVTGVATEVPAALVLAALRRVAPEVRRIGLLRGADPEAAAFGRRARSAARQAGLELVESVMDTPVQLPERARELASRSDAFWMPADPALARPEVFQYLLKLSLEERRPLVVFSEALVRRGALLAVVPDYAWAGEMAARAVRRIQSGERAGDIPLAPLERTLRVVNGSTARALGLEPPGSDPAYEVLP